MKKTKIAIIQLIHSVKPDVEVPLMDESFESDSADAFIAWEPYVSQSYLEGSGSLLVHSSDIWPNHPCCVVTANQGFVDNNPQKVDSVPTIFLTPLLFALN